MRGPEQLPCGQTLPIPFSDAPDAGAHPQELNPTQSLLPAHLLDGDEVVILAIKPSLWFVLFLSARWLAVMAVMVVLATWSELRLPWGDGATVVQAAVALGAARVGFALLQWVARLYVLTNRRILRLRGILNIDLFECPLNRIQNTCLTLAWYERLAGLGSIAFATAGTDAYEASWMNVNHPLEVHEQIRAAIDRARNPGGDL
ncbi:MAG: PH domain-containing protein [Phycisphaerae bacterium]|nr:PH domain-containing protein [Phycisphaerae bacterium]